MFNSDKIIKPVMFDNMNEIVDERGSTFIAMRKVQWCEEGKTPDREKAKLEIRKWRITPEGEERADKGFSFLTEEGPHELARALVHNGFGNTKVILKEIKTRDDFADAAKHLYDKEETSKGNGEYFDIRTALLNNNLPDNEGEDEDE
jgi:hypothetical protein